MTSEGWKIDGDGAAGPRAPRRRRWCAVRLSRARRGATSAERVGFAVRGRAAAHRRRAITVAAVHVLRTSSGGACPRHVRIPCALALCAHDVPCLYTRSARLRTPCCALGVPVCVCALCCWGLRDPLACARALCGTCAVRLCAGCSCCVCLCCTIPRCGRVELAYLCTGAIDLMVQTQASLERRRPGVGSIVSRLTHRALPIAFSKALRDRRRSR